MFAFPVDKFVMVRGVPSVRTISSGFGPRYHPVTGAAQQHSGIDFPVDEGTKVYAVYPGTVATVVYNNPTAGSYVEVDHGNGYWTRYLHLSSIGVTQGQKLKLGDSVGLSGGAPGKASSGLSTGPHLHFELWQGKPFGGGRALDPIAFLTDEAVGIAKQYWWAAAIAGIGISGLLIYRFRPEWFRGR